MYVLLLFIIQITCLQHTSNIVRSSQYIYSIWFSRNLRGMLSAVLYAFAQFLDRKILTRFGTVINFDRIKETSFHYKLKQVHKLFINIQPFVLQELDENIEGSVKTFLSLIKAIKIPEDNSHTSWATFWQELLSVMPDNRILDAAG